MSNHQHTDHAHEHAHGHEHEAHHIVSYTQNIWVWIILLILTAITVWAATVDFGNHTINVAIALIVATIKGSVVALYFMHLRYDNKMLGYFVIIAFAVFALVILIGFSDYAFR